MLCAADGSVRRSGLPPHLGARRAAHAGRRDGGGLAACRHPRAGDARSALRPGGGGRRPHRPAQPRGWRYTAPRELARAARSGNPITLVTIDLDNFKELNDEQGHEQGDR
ncbi:MAG: diguanylate cyclase, partial [Solirubrobacterales bacterium]|nr:diguanylate cyclase [Solirubrobacterales bacterium]